MIHTIHGAPHHSQVQVGDTKRLVSAVWKQSGEQKQFDNWFHPDSAVIASGPATVTPSVDSNGAPTQDISFTGPGIVEIDVTMNGIAQPKRLTIEVVI